MKFIGIILLLLTSIFLIACSANQASNKISNSELENLASKYGGVYVFNQKFVDEIDRREAERKELRKNIKGKDLGGGLYAVNTKVIDEKLPQILSNGKKYYTRWIDYKKEMKRDAKIPKNFIDMIINFIGLENFNKQKPYLDLGKLYVDDNGEVVPISIDVYYEIYNTKYGLFGDEGMGVSFSKKSVVPLSGGNKFILTNGKFERVSKDK
ncbi:tRNA 2-selenouridine synthase [Campylobacter concisus]|uniref:tRNA 2-selenouridine synthase n=1 Tax=Campylobacter concisus TaxID=199 RepID=UPI000CD982EB|nr:tRNA 2-selenouridine synthase [Campylobacter concisus]QPH94297.1 tRNA 2-selenouridine synthase [Campylobacter concisus]